MPLTGGDGQGRSACNREGANGDAVKARVQGKTCGHGGRVHEDPIPCGHIPSHRDVVIDIFVNRFLSRLVNKDALGSAREVD